MSLILRGAAYFRIIQWRHAHYIKKHYNQSSLYYASVDDSFLFKGGFNGCWFCIVLYFSGVISMDTHYWLNVWERDDNAFSLPSVNPDVISYWPKLPEGSRILVPLCGKSKDLLWLAEQGYQVIGVELSERTVVNFFRENKIDYLASAMSIHQKIYQAKHLSIKLIVGNFFDFQKPPFDALYDYASMLVLPKALRERYVKHCMMMLKPESSIVLTSLDYASVSEDELPFSITKEEVSEYWGSSLKHVKHMDCRDDDLLFQGKKVKHAQRDIWVRQYTGKNRS